MYVHGNMPGRNDLKTANKLTHYLPERKAIAASLQLREEGKKPPLERERQLW